MNVVALITKAGRNVDLEIEHRPGRLKKFDPDLLSAI
jgi:hypothetical protein